jgi:hypothetical protein
MDGPSAFSSDGADVIGRQVDLAEQTTKTGSLGRDDDEDLALEEYYEVQYTVQEILRHDFKRVSHHPTRCNATDTSLQIALQFSDDMLGDSVPVYTALKKTLHASDANGHSFSNSLTVDLVKDTRSLFVLADTSYGRFPPSLVPHIAGQVSDLTDFPHLHTTAVASTKWLLNM